MTTSERAALAFASLLLLVMYIAPLWSITLQAPQYPEGLGLKIMLSDVQGQKQHDLSNINNLNHYIGMKRIEPDAIPELKVMPWIVAGLLVLGLIAAGSGSRTLMTVWVVVFLLVAIAGLIDFWMWAYDYGHNLDTEHAAIKVPGMSYQPPVIGSKQLLNFKAHSWPAVGGWAAFVSLGIGVLLVVRPWRWRTRVTPLALVLAATMSLAACTSGPPPIHYGSDRDDFCRMTISDMRFGTQLQTTTGRTYRFDSVECLKGFLESGQLASQEVAAIWLTDAANPGTFIEAGAAFVVSSPEIRSPMGGGLIAYADSAEADRHARASGGEVSSWQDVVQSSLQAHNH